MLLKLLKLKLLKLPLLLPKLLKLLKLLLFLKLFLVSQKQETCVTWFQEETGLDSGGKFSACLQQDSLPARAGEGLRVVFSGQGRPLGAPEEKLKIIRQQQRAGRAEPLRPSLTPVASDL